MLGYIVDIFPDIQLATLSTTTEENGCHVDRVHIEYFHSLVFVLLVLLTILCQRRIVRDSLLLNPGEVVSNYSYFCTDESGVRFK